MSSGKNPGDVFSEILRKVLRKAGDILTPAENEAIGMLTPYYHALGMISGAAYMLDRVDLSHEVRVQMLAEFIRDTFGQDAAGLMQELRRMYQINPAEEKLWAIPPEQLNETAREVVALARSRALAGKLIIDTLNHMESARG